MTTRKLKKLIKSEVEKIKMPDLSEQVTRQILISKANRYLENKEEIDKQRKRASFKTAALIPAFSAIIISIMVIVINLIPNGTVTSETTKRHRAYAMQAITLVNFAENYDETVNLSSQANETGLMRLSKTSYSYEECASIANKINQYLLSAQELMNSEELSYEVIDSNKENYQYMMSINIDIFGSVETYTLYFNEEPLEDIKDFDLDEVSSKLTGIIVFNNHEYLVEGIKEIEDDEQEIELKMFLSEDLSKFLIVNQEVEYHENEYSYSYYDNGKLIQKFEMSVESKNNHKVVELEIIQDNNVYELEFSYQNKIILVDYEINNYEGKVKVTTNSLYYIYNFSEDIKINIKK